MAERARGPGRKTSLITALSTLTLSATLAGGVTLAFVAALGSTFPVGARSLLTIAGLAAVASSAKGRPSRPWQRDVETTQWWLLRENLSVAILNGAALGAGFVTRIGYWAWWLLPLYAFQTGNVPVGFTIGATYAAARIGVSSSVAVYADRSGNDPLLSIIARRRLLMRGGTFAIVGGTVVLAVATMAMDLNK